MQLNCLSLNKKFMKIGKGGNPVVWIQICLVQHKKDSMLCPWLLCNFWISTISFSYLMHIQIHFTQWSNFSQILFKCTPRINNQCFCSPFHTPVFTKSRDFRQNSSVQRRAGWENQSNGKYMWAQPMQALNWCYLTDTVFLGA